MSNSSFSVGADCGAESFRKLLIVAERLHQELFAKT
jgi:hypothetical protein